MPEFHTLAPDFEAAEVYFEQYPEAVKWRRKDGSQCSFVKMGDKIFALIAVRSIRKDDFSKAKFAIDKEGHSYSLEVFSPIGSHQLGFYTSALKTLYPESAEIGQTVTRPSSSQKYGSSGQKTYITAPYLGFPVSEMIEQQPDNIRLEISIRAALALHDFHAKGLIHGNVQRKHFVINNQGEVSLIGWEASRPLSEPTNKSQSLDTAALRKTLTNQSRLFHQCGFLYSHTLKLPPALKEFLTTKKAEISPYLVAALLIAYRDKFEITEAFIRDTQNDSAAQLALVESYRGRQPSLYFTFEIHQEVIPVPVDDEQGMRYEGF